MGLNTSSSELIKEARSELELRNKGLSGLFVYVAVLAIVPNYFARLSGDFDRLFELCIEAVLTALGATELFPRCMSRANFFDRFLEITSWPNVSCNLTPSCLATERIVVVAQSELWSTPIAREHPVSRVATVTDTHEN
jgi:hypothetical protein